MRLGTKLSLVATLLLSTFSAKSQLTIAWQDESGVAGGVQFTLGLTGREQYYVCEAATNGDRVTFINQLITASSQWVLTVPGNALWPIRLETTTNNVLDTSIPPSATNYVLGDLRPNQLSVSASSVTSVNLVFRNLAVYQTGFLAEVATNSYFTNSVLYNVAPASGPNVFTNWIHNFSFLANVTYYYRLYATNSNGKTFPSAYVQITPNAIPAATTSLISHTTGVSGQVENKWFYGGGYYLLGGSVQNWLLQQAIGSPVSWTTISAPVNASSMSFLSSGLTAGQTYYFRVAATNSAGTGPWVTNAVYMPIAGTPTGGNWYVDLNAPTNSNFSGTNWANAWPNMSSINWPLISAGNTIWVAKGNYGESVITVTPGVAPNVIIHAATNSAQKGSAYFQSFTVQQPYVTINGAMDDNFVSPVGAFPAMWGDTNNIAFTIASTNQYYVAGVYGNQSDNTSTQTKWCIIGPVGVWIPSMGEVDVTGVNYPSSFASNSVVSHCWIKDIMGTGIGINGGGPMFGYYSIDHTIMERVHCNYASSAYGGDIFNNYWLSASQNPQVGHPDGWQGLCGWMRIYNNRLQDCNAGYMLYFELGLTNATRLTHDLLVYGNEISYDTIPLGLSIEFTTEPLAYYPSSPVWKDLTVSNVVILNNTLINYPLSIDSRNSDVTNLYLQNWVIANNVAYAPSTYSMFNLGKAADLTKNTNAIYATSDMRFDFNDLPNGLVTYSTNITTITQLAASTPYTHNVNTTIPFVNNMDLHLTNSLAGTNLSSLLSLCPSLNVDMDGNTRTTWNMGAYEAIKPYGLTNDPSLICHIQFNDSSKNFYHDDSGNHAAMMQEDIYHWPNIITGPNTNIITAANFNQVATLDPKFFAEGQYGAIIHTNEIDGMTNCTMSLWLKNYVPIDGIPASVHQSAWMSGGAENQGEAVGSFYWGRMQSLYTYLIVRTNISSVRPLILTWPDVSTDGSYPWHHLAWTFSASANQFIGYYDGVPFQTNQTYGIPAIHVGGAGYVSVSGWPHDGTPQWNVYAAQTDFNDHTKLDDGQPNAGWINGALADIRIYNRALSSTEVLALASGGVNGTPVLPQFILGNGHKLNLNGSLKLNN